MTSSAPQESRTTFGPLLAVLILALAAVLRVLAALGETMWFDELYTVAVATRPPAELLGIVARDIHPPLHYLLVAAWCAIGGTGDLWVKGLSIVLGVASVGAAGLLARAMFGGPAALVAMGLLTLHRTHVAFSTESRSYALLMLLLTLALWAAWRWRQDGRRGHAIAFVLASAAALYTHYLAGAALFMVFLFGLTGPRRGGWVLLHVAVALLFAPQLPVFAGQAARLAGDTWVPVADVGNLLDWLRHLALGALYVIPLMLPLAVWPLFVRERHVPAALLWLGAILPPVILWALSMAGTGVFIERHMFFALPAWAALVAAGLTSLKPRALAAGLTALLLLAAARTALMPVHHPEMGPLRAAAAFMAEQVQANDVVVHADAHSFTYFRHYQPAGAAHVLLLPTPHLAYYEGDLVTPAEARWSPADLRAALAGGANVWGVHLRYRYAPADTAALLLARAARDTVYAVDRMRVWWLGAAPDSAR